MGGLFEEVFYVFSLEGNEVNVPAFGIELSQINGASALGTPGHKSDFSYGTLCSEVDGKLNL